MADKEVSHDALHATTSDLLDEKLADLKKDLATKICLLERYVDRIEANEGRIRENEKRIKKLEQYGDEAEQYQRRLIVRIYGVEIKEELSGESGNKCLKNVKNMLKQDLKVDIPECCNQQGAQNCASHGRPKH